MFVILNLYCSFGIKCSSYKTVSESKKSKIIRYSMRISLVVFIGFVMENFDVGDGFTHDKKKKRVNI